LGTGSRIGGQATLILCILVVFAFAGCASEADSLIGAWDYSDQIAEQLQANDIQVSSPVLIFEKNDTVIFHDGSDNTMTGTYSFADHKVTLSFSGETAYDNGSDPSIENTAFDLVKKGDGSYVLQLQNADIFIKK
jgi:hypothetical protein